MYASEVFIIFNFQFISTVAVIGLRERFCKQATHVLFCPLAELRRIKQIQLPGGRRRGRLRLASSRAPAASIQPHELHSPSVRAAVTTSAKCKFNKCSYQDLQHPD